MKINAESGGFFAVLAFTALLLTWTAVGPCLNNGFVNWDEQKYIQENRKIRSLTPESAAAIFTSRDLGMYSPLSTLSYAVNYRFSGLSPKAYHGTDIALHLANTTLVMLLVRLLLPGLWPAFLCGLFFGIHPAHIESVAWAAERKDLLYSFFYLLSLCAYTLSLKGKRTYLAALGFFVCSLLSKPMAVTLPLTLLLVDYLKLKSVGWPQWAGKLPFFVIAAVFSLAVMPPASEAVRWAPFGLRLGLALYNFGFYLYTLAWPFDLSAMYVLPPGGIKFMYLYAAATAACAALFFRYFRRDKAVMFGAGFYAAALLPVLQLIPFGPVISADRYTYISSLGLFIGAYALAAGGWARCGAPARKTVVFLVAAAAMIFTVTARVRCAVWKDGISLWTDTLLKQPSAKPALGNLCAAYLHAGRDGEAAQCLAGATRIYPENSENFYNFGVLTARNGDLSAARKYFEHTLQMQENHTLALFSLGKLAQDSGQTARAEKFFLRAVECDGAFAPALRGLGGIAASRNDKAAARKYYERADKENPPEPSGAALPRQP